MKFRNNATRILHEYQERMKKKKAFENWSQTLSEYQEVFWFLFAYYIKCCYKILEDENCILPLLLSVLFYTTMLNFNTL